MRFGAAKWRSMGRTHAHRGQVIVWILVSYRFLLTIGIIRGAVSSPLCVRARAWRGRRHAATPAQREFIMIYRRIKCMNEWYERVRQRASVPRAKKSAKPNTPGMRIDAHTK